MLDNQRLIILLGQTGVGKGSNISKVNPDIVSQENDTISYHLWDFPFHGQRIVLVDTPGFNSTQSQYYKPLDDLLKWLDNLKTVAELQNAKFLGFLYLFEDGQHDFPLRDRILQEFPETVSERTIFVLSKGGNLGFRINLPPELYKTYDNTIESANQIVNYLPPDGIEITQLISALKRISLRPLKLIIFLGQSGVGKSCYHIWNSPASPHKDIVLVDTPGFNSTEGHFYEPLNNLIEWLDNLKKLKYKQNIEFRGIMYIFKDGQHNFPLLDKIADAFKERAVFVLSRHSDHESSTDIKLPVDSEKCNVFKKTKETADDIIKRAPDSGIDISQLKSALKAMKEPKEGNHSTRWCFA
ncbi:hypothetical protein BDQ17DRAFT_1326481 [Cyathus striatus]|nr:hypothetical protein BDQ17DRAFT_1326481 [Cyathus striatus]